MNIAGALTLGLILSITCGCGHSGQEKANIRLAVSAYSAAVRGHGQDERLMDELQRSIDVLPDADTRDAFSHCQSLLKIYGLTLRRIGLAYKANLLATGHSRNTATQEASEAIAKAKKEIKQPDVNQIFECEIVQLPALAR